MAYTIVVLRKKKYATADNEGAVADDDFIKKDDKGVVELKQSRFTEFQSSDLKRNFESAKHRRENDGLNQSQESEDNDRKFMANVSLFQAGGMNMTKNNLALANMSAIGGASFMSMSRFGGNSSVLGGVRGFGSTNN